MTAVNAAEAILETDPLTPRARELRARVFELAEGLFQSIRLQLSVTRYAAIAVGRGANLDTVDASLNNRRWLLERFAEIKAATDELDRLAKIDAIVNWTNPGPGGFYDDLGDLQRQPHLVAGEGFDKDPESRNSALIGFGIARPDRGGRLSWYNHAEALFDGSLKMKYTDLDPRARYKIRVVYGGDMLHVPIKLVANGSMTIHDFVKKPLPVAPLEFEIPAEATRSGTLNLEWTRPAGLGGNGRGAQVSEVWLIRSDASR
jgi:hypothetical protein